VRWVLDDDPFGRPRSVLLGDDDERLAEVRHPDTTMPFPMFHYQCLRCRDNLGSAEPLRSLKNRARPHQLDAHQEATR